MTIDTPSDGDEVIRAAGEALLIVDRRIAGSSEGVMDYDFEVLNGEPRAKFRLVPASREG